MGAGRGGGGRGGGVRVWVPWDRVLLLQVKAHVSWRLVSWVESHKYTGQPLGPLTSVHFYLLLVSRFRMSLICTAGQNIMTIVIHLFTYLFIFQFPFSWIWPLWVSMEYFPEHLAFTPVNTFTRAENYFIPPSWQFDSRQLLYWLLVILSKPLFWFLQSLIITFLRPISTYMV